MKWLASGIPENLRDRLTDTDIEKFGSSFCAHLMAAGVLRPIDDRGETKNILFTVSSRNVNENFQQIHRLRETWSARRT